MIELARIFVELLYPGAEIKGRTLQDWYLGHPRFHTHRVTFPGELSAEPDTATDIVTLHTACQLVSVQPIGESIVGVASGVMDHHMIMKGIPAALGPSLEQIIQIAESQAPEPVEHRAQIAWIGMFDVDEEKEEVTYLGRLSLEGLTCRTW